MDERDEQKKYAKNLGEKKRNKWWIWVVIAIIAIVVLWLAFDKRTNLNRPDPTPGEPAVFVEDISQDPISILGLRNNRSRWV